MERLDNDIAHYLTHRSNRNKLYENDLDHMIKQILNGLDHMHKHKLTHRDLKPTNILLRLIKDQQPIVKIADFGYIHHIPISGKGTQGYAAPELLAQLTSAQHPLLIGVKTDIYSLGVTTRQILSNAHTQNTGRLSAFWFNIAERCQDIDPTNRPFCSQIIQERENL